MLPNLITPLMELLRADIGFSSGTLTLIFVAYISGLVPSLLFAPGFGSFFGRRRMLIFAAASGIVSCIFYLLSGSVGILLIARFLTGLCSGFTLVLGTLAIKYEASEDEIPKATLLGTLGIAIGLAGGPLLAGVVAAMLPAPTKTVFFIEAAILICALLVILTQQKSERAKPEHWLPFRGITRKTWTIVLSGLGAFGPGMTAAAIILALAPTILAGMGGIQGPLAAGAMAGGMYVASPIAQTLVRGRESKQLIRGAILLIVVSMGTMVGALYFNNLVVMGIAAALIGAGQGISNLGSFGLIHQNVDTKQVAGATALLSIGTYASATFIPLLGGVLVDKSGLLTSGIVMAIGVALMCVLGLGLNWSKRQSAE